MPEWLSGWPTLLPGTTPEEILISYFFFSFSFFVVLFCFLALGNFFARGPHPTG